MREKISARDRALFRFTVISKVRALTINGTPLPAAIRLIAKSDHLDPKMKLKSVSERSIYRWIKAFNQSEFDGLFDIPKKKLGFSNVLSSEFGTFLKIQKLDNPEIALPEIIRRAEKKGIIPSSTTTSRTSVWRACNRLNLPMTRVKYLKDTDMRRFSYQHRMQMVLCDGTHFRVGVKKTKRVAIIFLDDATRYALHAVVGPSESEELFLRGFFETINRHGKMVSIFTDNGSGFKANDAKEICARLNINSIFGKVGYPEGHGKIERLNQTLKKDLLHDLYNKVGADDNCSHLELAIQTYFKKDYATREHEGLGGIPEKRFFEDSRPLDFPASIETLKQKFTVREKRKVSKDNIVKLNGVAYEMPLGYAGTNQEIRRHILDHEIFFLHEGVLQRLHPVDLHHNAYARRHKKEKLENDTASSIEDSSASMSFQEHFRPIVDSDGGFHNKE